MMDNILGKKDWSSWVEGAYKQSDKPTGKEMLHKFHTKLTADNNELKKLLCTDRDFFD